MREALRVEVLKAVRSRVPVVSTLAFAVATGVGGLFMFILQDPARARSLGLLGEKSQLASGTADWASYLALLAQTVAVGGILIFGLVMIWVFGREFSDQTAKDLLALPTSRTAIVSAKFMLVAVWCLALTVACWLLGLLTGAALRLPGWSGATALGGAGRMIVTAVLTLLLTTLLALTASGARGYLAAVGVMALMVFLAQVVAILGYGHYFPLSVPAVYSGLAGPDQPPVGPIGYATVIVTGLGGVAGTIVWWGRADHSR